MIGVFACSIFLASPGKKILSKRVRAYMSPGSPSRPGIKRNESMESLQGATLGIPVDPEKEFDELVEEVMEELRKRTGGLEIKIEPPELKKLVEEKLLQRRTSSEVVEHVTGKLKEEEKEGKKRI
jgi:lysophospholipid acyltransferase